MEFKIDKAIVWSVINRSVSIIKGPLSLYFIITFLTPKIQGLWYTFGSLSALTIFAELGFLTIITQFISHEFASMSEVGGNINGDQTQLSRFFGLIKFSFKFYSIVVPVAIILLAITGSFFFKSENQNIKWAWLIYSIAGGIDLLLSLFQAIYAGINKVKESQINALIYTSLSTVITWIMLILNFSIWALVYGNLIGAFIAMFVFYLRGRTFWKQVIRFKSKQKHSFLKETLPLQAKYAISWISAFFILNILIPTAYKFTTKVEAGQLGITLALIAAIAAISNSLVNAKIPLINMFVAKANYSDLNILFKRIFKQSMILQTVAFLMALIMLIFLGKYQSHLANRFLPLYDIVLLMAAQYPQLTINFLSIYMRAHKEEPLMWAILFQSILIIIAVIVFMRLYNLKVFLYSMNGIYFLLALPLTIYIFTKKYQSYKYYANRS
jgi:O-antigen/teichoic acid export membrane protein